MCVLQAADSPSSCLHYTKLFLLAIFMILPSSFLSVATPIAQMALFGVNQNGSFVWGIHGWSLVLFGIICFISSQLPLGKFVDYWYPWGAVDDQQEPLEFEEFVGEPQNEAEGMPENVPDMEQQPVKPEDVEGFEDLKLR